jgi:alkanesulfonate monooxygenase SsuD/methylene tetrahydromethanopterin reductase-like flavin-dependent oxidoreductase (luciferase family)
MRFGVFYEHQLPRPWDVDAEHRLLHESLDQIERADQLGYDYAWEVEHHFMEEYSHSSAPEVFLAAASQRTSRIRLGHGIVQLTTNHPARVAERVSTLDLLSSGRVELGIGEGSSVTELHPFDRRFRDKRSIWEDAVRCLIPMFADGGTEYHGEHFDFPLRNVVPKPRQKPHPPLWVALLPARDDPHGGTRGMGALGFQFVSAEAARAWVHAYYNAYTKRLDPLADYATNPSIAVVSQFMCAPTDEEAERMAEGRRSSSSPSASTTATARSSPAPVDLWEEFLAFRDTPKGQAARRGGLIGSPATIRERLHRFADSHVDQVILLNQAGKNSHADIVSSLELFAAEVMPEFHALEGEQQAWKAAVLAGEIELEEIDTEAYSVRTYVDPSKAAAAG